MNIIDLLNQFISNIASPRGRGGKKPGPRGWMSMTNDMPVTSRYWHRDKSDPRWAIQPGSGGRRGGRDHDKCNKCLISGGRGSCSGCQETGDCLSGECNPNAGSGERGYRGLSGLFGTAHRGMSAGPTCGSDADDDMNWGLIAAGALGALVLLNGGKSGKRSRS
jgi:hypothetical protein